MPEVYTHGHHESVLRSHKWRTAENSAGYLLPHLASDAKVLDVGCGPGTITAGLADRVPQGQVTGIDASPEVVEQARAAGGGRANLGFATGDVYALDYPDSSFDVVHAHQVLQHLGDPVRALREMRRVTRPGGFVAVRDADFGGMTWYPELPILDEWRAFYTTVARGNGGEPHAGRRLRAWARAAGFTDVTCTSSNWTYATETERSWWGGLWADRTVKSTFAATATAGGHADAGYLERIADGWRVWAADEDGWFLVPHGEIICRAVLPVVSDHGAYSVTSTGSPTRISPGESGMMFCPKTRDLPNRRRAASIFSGCPPRSPVTWSVVVTTQRPQGLATRKDTEPIRTRRQRSSAHGSKPVTTTLGRNRFIGTGWSPAALSHSPS
jgi:SAM-dependent methyltransferase